MTPIPFVGPDPLDGTRPLFGRRRDVRRVFDLLSAERVILLHSPSGAGKSSFVQAGLECKSGNNHGLLKEMRQAGFQVLPVTRANRNPRACEVSLGAAVNRYSWSIRERLASAPASGEYIHWPPARRAELTLAEFLTSSFPSKLPQAPMADGRSEAGDGGQVPDYLAWVLVIDQFEEVLTEDPTDIDTKKAFFKELGEAMNACRNIWFVLVMREELTAALDPYLCYLPRRVPARYRLEMLSKPVARNVIEQIDASTGEPRFRSDGIDEMVRDLASVRLEVANGRFENRDRGYVEPMHLQIECRDLWRRHPGSSSIGKKEVIGHGDFKHSLMRYYGEQLAELDLGDDERTVREWLDKHLILRGAYRYQIPKEVDDTAGLSNNIVHALVERHILREENREGKVWVELAHDRLVEAVHDANQEWYQTHLGRFQQFAMQWEKGGRPREDLMQGKRLQAMQQRWKGRSLRPYEKDFLTASLQREEEVRRARQLRDQERRQREQEERKKHKNRVIAFLAASMLCVSLFAFGLYRQRQEVQSLREEAERGRQEQLKIAQAYALATRLSDDSDRLLSQRSGGDELPALLARQAFLFAQRLKAPGGRLTAVTDPALRRIFERTVFGRRKHGPAWATRAALPDVAGLACLLLSDIDQADKATVDFLDGSPPWELQLPPTTGEARGIAVDAARHLLAIATENVLAVWPIGPDGGPESEPVLQAPVKAVHLLAFAPRGKHLVALTSDGTIHLYDTSRLPFGHRALEGLDKTWRALAFSPDGSLLVAGADDRTLTLVSLTKLADPKARSVTLQSLRRPFELHALAVTPDARHAVLAGSRRWHPESDPRGLLLLVPLTESDQIRARRLRAPHGRGRDGARVWTRIAISADGAQLATGAEDGHIGWWQLPSLEADSLPVHLRADGLRIFRAGTRPIRALGFVDDGRSVLSIDALAAAFEWTALNPPGMPVVVRHQDGEVTDIAFDSASGQLFAAGSSRGVIAWSSRDDFAEASTMFAIDGNSSQRVSIGPDGAQVLIGYADGEVELRVRGNGTVRGYRQRRHSGPVSGMAIAANGDRFAIADVGDGLSAWDTKAFRQDPQTYRAARLSRSSDASVSLALSPDGLWLAAGGRSLPLSVWDLLSKAPRSHRLGVVSERGLVENGPRLRNMAFSPDGRHLASVWDDGKVRVVDWRSEDSSFLTLAGGDPPVAAVAFAGDGDLVTGAADGSIRKWSLMGPHRDTIVLSGFSQPVTALWASGSGDKVAAGGANGQVALWHLPGTPDLAEEVCRLVGRNMSRDEWTQYVGKDLSYECTCPAWGPGSGVTAQGCSRNAGEDSADAEHRSLEGSIRDRSHPPRGQLLSPGYRPLEEAGTGRPPGSKSVAVNPRQYVRIPQASLSFRNRMPIPLFNPAACRKRSECPTQPRSIPASRSPPRP